MHRSRLYVLGHIPDFDIGWIYPQVGSDRIGRVVKIPDRSDQVGVDGVRVNLATPQISRL